MNDFEIELPDGTKVTAQFNLAGTDFAIPVDKMKAMLAELKVTTEVTQTIPPHLAVPEAQEHDRKCTQMLGPHVCILYNCSNDDPEHIHVCFADDFDWTAMEQIQWRHERITAQEIAGRAYHRAVQRLTHTGRDSRMAQYESMWVNRKGRPL